MGTNNKESSSVPWVKFRWCRAIPCQTKEVYLILTSITGSEINLEWKSNLGWFESDIVSLPCGLHTGFILLREKVSSSASSEYPNTVERDYQIDPFFINPHKFSVELFLQSSVELDFWKENFVRNRYLSLHNIESEIEGDRKNFALSRQRSFSCDGISEVTKPIIFNYDKENNNFALNFKINLRRNSTNNAEDIKTKNCWVGSNEIHESPITREIIVSGKGNNHEKAHHKNSVQLNENDETLSLDTEINNCDKDNFSSIEAKHSRENIFPVSLTESKLAYSNHLHLKESPKEEESNLSSQILQRSIYFREVANTKNNGCDECIITFENCSSSSSSRSDKSRNDVGSQGTLEDSLVILDLVERGTEEQQSSPSKQNFSSDIDADTKNNKRLISQTIFPTTISGASKLERHQTYISSSQSSTSEKYSKILELDATLHEDENFQYDSLKNDEHKIPINIRELLDSEDSIILSGEALMNANYLEENKETNISSTLEDLLTLKIIQTTDNFSHEKKNLKFDDSNNLQQIHVSSRNEHKVADDFVPVDPGSLRSETENGIREEIAKRNRFPKNVATVKKIKDKKKVQNASKSNKSYQNTESEKRLKMSSVGTQTFSVKSFLNTDSSEHTNYSKIFSKNLDEKYVNLLPDKMTEPRKFMAKNKTLFHSRNFDLKGLQRNLHNISKANNILKKMHPFDYRPTLIHEDKTFSTANRSHHKLNSAKERLLSSTNFDLNTIKPCRESVCEEFNTSFKTKPLKSLASNVRTPSFEKYVPNSLMFRPKAKSSLYSSKPIFMNSTIIPKYYLHGRSRNYYEQHKTLPVQKCLLNISETGMPLSNLYQGKILGSRLSSSEPSLNKEIVRPNLLNKSHVRRKRLSATSTPSFFNEFFLTDQNQIENRNLWKFPENIRRNSCEGMCSRRCSNGASTDSLIEEALTITDQFKEKKSKAFGFSNFEKERYFLGAQYDSDVLRRSDLQRNKKEIPVSKILRARSETDLRIIGKFGHGHANDRPYLPYRRDQLSFGQIVKVLIPGEGVALARVVYNPIYPSYSFDSDYENISVVLLSEPQSLLGTIVSLPLDKFLLAWPKIQTS